MATYKEIKGVTVQTLDSDPVVNAGSWSTGGALNQAKKQMGGAGLTPTASIVFGGVQGSPPSLATTESYNGTSWTELNDMPQVSQYLAGMGTSTAAVAIAGIGGPGDPPKGDYVQEWNGSSWSTNPNAYPFTAYSLAGAGTATAAIISGGDPARTDVNTFDGTSFTSSTAMSTGRRGHGSVGTTTANLVVGGETPRTANTEIWNGSSWTEVNNYPTATQDLSAWGTSTSAIGALGYTTTNTANSASWDGTSWTATADLATARNGANRGGLGTNNTEGLVAGGEAPPVTTSTEEWGFPPVTAAVLNEGDMFLSGGVSFKAFGKATGVPAGTWASGGDLNTARQQGNGVGPQTANLFFGGIKAGPAFAAETEEYNGTAWTEKNDLNTERDSMAAGGTTTAAITAFGSGTPASPPITNIVELWDGSSWTETTDANTLRYSLGGVGKQTDLIAFGGYTTTVLGNVETWDGSSWTETTELNQNKSNIGSSGTSSISALGFGGYLPGSPNHTANTEEWNGSSWTELNNLNTSRYNVVGGGSVPGCLGTGGFTTTSVNNVETWNGTSWTEQSEIATNRFRGGGGGSVVAGIFSGGGNPPTLYANTEEWTVDATLSTVTVS